MCAGRLNTPQRVRIVNVVALLLLFCPGLGSAHVLLAEAWGYEYRVERKDDGRALVFHNQGIGPGQPVQQKGEMMEEELPASVAAWGQSLVLTRFLEDEISRPLPEEEVIRVLEAQTEAGVVTPYSEERRVFGTLVREALDTVIALDDPGPDLVFEIFEEVWETRPVDVNLDGELFNRESFNAMAHSAAEGHAEDLCCFPLTREEVEEANEKIVRGQLIRFRIADELIDLYNLMESEKLRAEAEQIVEERGKGEDPEWALRAMLREREWVRYQLDKAAYHITFHDPELEAKVREKWSERRVRLDREMKRRHMDLPWNAPDVAPVPLHESADKGH